MKKLVLGVAAIGLAGCQAPDPGSESAALSASSVVISQLYPEGGNSGSNLDSSFLELFNRGTADQSLGGWSLQYASHAVTTTWGVHALPAVTIPAGRYYLVELATGGTGTHPFPTGATQVPDTTITTLGPAGTSGKVALVNTTTELTCGATADSCAGNAAIVDLLGYGGAATTEYETAPAPAPPSGNNAIYVRGGAGCTDASDNATDFATLGTVPADLTTLVVRNATSAANPCAPSTSTDMAVSVGPHDLAEVDTDGGEEIEPDLAVPATDMNHPLVTGSTPYNGANGCSVGGGVDASAVALALLALVLLRRRRA